MRFSTLLSLAFAGIAYSHIVITYPGWRGDNLRDNDDFPFGMQWEYPCKLRTVLFSVATRTDP